MSGTTEIDESLYSRQLYVMGHEAQRRMAVSSVLIVGLNGLGVEVAKNVILAGVKSVTLYDEKVCGWGDLSSQFYLHESNIGQNRAAISAPKLAELNPYVHVSVVQGDLSEVISKGTYNVVVLIDQTWETQSSVAEYCHSHDIAVILGDVRGVFGQIFCDFGKAFVVYDTDGEPAASSMIANISQDEKALVTTLEETRHNLSSGDKVVLTDIVGMVELNQREFTVEVKDNYSFEINVDSRNFQRYERSGYVNQVKQPKTIPFSSLAESFGHPGEICIDFTKFERGSVLHLVFHALQLFKAQHEGQCPRPGNTDDAHAFYELVKQVNGQWKTSGLTDVALSDEALAEQEQYVKRFALASQGMISPVCSVVGGVLGQEVLKACSGKFMPIKQWYYYDAFEALPTEILPEEEVAPRGCRYDGQIAIYGSKLQRQLQGLSVFLVGAGAIGCEILKNWAMMGIACALPESLDADAARKVGTVYVTDMDQIEKSNLSRQFLFRNHDINHAKSTTAVNAVKHMNTAFRGVAYEQKVAAETEHIFHDEFYEGMDLVCSALDNVEARLYLDSKCVFYNKPLLESGTLGTKGHTQIVIPKLTENYGATRDPPEKSIPVCTLKHFPNQIEHTLQWGREWFEEVFKQAADDVQQYLDNPGAFLENLKSSQNTQYDTLKRLQDSLVQNRPRNISDCITWARQTFEDLYHYRIQQLLFNFPLDRRTANGTLFWSGSKKPPSIIYYDSGDVLHQEFIISVANMRAQMFNLPVCQDSAYMLAVAQNVTVKPFQPQAGVKIAATEEEMKAQDQESKQSAAAGDIDAMSQQIASSLPSADNLKSEGFSIKVIDFDKDIDAHMRVVAAVSNLRARNYRIPEADLHTSRGIAGKITPAIATTTALVCGGICMELYKYLYQKPLSAYQNTFTNLAIPLFTSMEPEPPKPTKALIKGEEWKWTQWDRIDVLEPNLTVEGLIVWLKEKYGLELSMLSSGVTILFSDFMDRKKMAERRVMTLPKLVETVGKKEIPSNQKYLIFELIVNDVETGEEVEVPYLRYKI